MSETLTAALAPQLSGRRVALVGNARSLAAAAMGPEIDGCDLVIRLNAAPRCEARSHGCQTHWLGTSGVVAPSRLRQLSPRLLLWMTPRRRWRARLAYGWRWPLLFYPEGWWQSLAAALGSRPSTGLMMIDLLLRVGGFAQLGLYGFDFFRSGSLSARGLDQAPPHDFAREAAHLEALMRGHAAIRLRGQGGAAEEGP